MVIYFYYLIYNIRDMKKRKIQIDLKVSINSDDSLRTKKNSSFHKINPRLLDSK